MNSLLRLLIAFSPLAMCIVVILLAYRHTREK